MGKPSFDDVKCVDFKKLTNEQIAMHRKLVELYCKQTDEHILGALKSACKAYLEYFGDVFPSDRKPYFKTVK